jgi:hypothetical protein
LILRDALGRLPDGPESSETREWLSSRGHRLQRSRFWWVLPGTTAACAAILIVGSVALAIQASQLRAHPKPARTDASLAAPVEVSLKEAESRSGLTVRVLSPDRNAILTKVLYVPPTANGGGATANGGVILEYNLNGQTIRVVEYSDPDPNRPVILPVKSYAAQTHEEINGQTYVWVRSTSPRRAIMIGEKLPDGTVVQLIAQPNGLTDAEMLDIVDHLLVLPPAAG